MYTITLQTVRQVTTTIRLHTGERAIIIAITIAESRAITTMYTITLQTVHQVTTTIRLHMVVTLPTITAQIPTVAIRPTRAQVVIMSITKTSKL